MADITPTRAQQAVIDNRGGALLVSAAAGSGKTKVLVERLLGYVLDKASPANIDDFLIITYTNAAAAELRGKITQALSGALAKDPANRHLQRQLSRIYLAQISTVHSFCSMVLRRYAHLLELPPDFSIMDAAEEESLRGRVLDELLEKSYSRLKDDAALAAAMDRLCFTRDDRRLAEILLAVYDASRCRPQPDQWLERCLKAYDLQDCPAEKTVWGEYFVKRLRTVLCHAEKSLRACAELSAADPVLEMKLCPLLLENAEQCRCLSRFTRWDELYENRVVDFGRMPVIRSCGDPDAKQYAQNVRKRCLEDIRQALKPFYAKGEQVVQDLLATKLPLSGLIGLVKEFSKQYSQEKLRRRMMDFSDLEQQTLRFLHASDRACVEAAQELAGSFREILVDEYQDSNAVQEEIFESISQQGKNLFMVGDVKQSIYRFRLAQPEIFLDKYEKYPPAADAKAGEGRKLLLSENFRSRPEILSGINDVFRLVMSKDAAELEYGEDEMLRAGMRFADMPERKIELHCIQLDIASGEEEAAADKAEEEAAFVAERIHTMLQDGTQITDGGSLRPVQPGDIVILLRSPEASAGEYQRALHAYGIASFSDRGGNLFDTTEAAVFLALLQIIDNPHRETALTAALLSPVFAIAPEIAAQARTKNAKCDLYDCLRDYAPQDKALSCFFTWLDAMREKAAVVPLSRLVQELLRTTQLSAVFSAMSNGYQRRENLFSLSQLCLQFEQRGGGSLSRFVRYLEQLSQQGLAPQQKTRNDAVRIMSIHRSKGLEFPVVFLADLSKRFNLQDSSSPVLTDDTLFIGCHVVDPENRSCFSSAARSAIADKTKAQTVAEEMRVLYVAMTRAKERLIMSYCSQRLLSTLEKWNGILSDPLQPEIAASAGCIGDWILMAALCRTESSALFEQVGPSRCSRVNDAPWGVFLHSAAELKNRRSVQRGASAEENAEICCFSAAQEALDYRYPHPEAALLPSKLTATQLKGRFLDSEAAEQAGTRFEAPPPKWDKADFSAHPALTGREKGNATHLFMQFVRYEKCTSGDGVAQELTRLTEDRFLRPEQAEAVDRQKILRLFSSDFGKRILRAENVRREFKFSVLEDAAKYEPNAHGETVMLQGVVDCFWQEEDGLVIVDFKTDRIVSSVYEKAELYRPQLTAYASALGAIYEAPVKECWLYFFDKDQPVKL